MTVQRSDVRLDVTLGDYIQALYEAFLEDLGDEDLAEVATMAVVQQRLVDQRLVLPAR
jgi:hypothetical protein